jgi:peptidoglycan hydrolase-like protein with peptidoglycan-binding domain
MSADAPQDCTFIPEIRIGSRGEIVRQLQAALSAEGLDPGGEDGIFGPDTREAVLAFQRSQQLTEDGVVRLSTAAALGLTVGLFQRPRRRISRRDADPSVFCSPPPEAPPVSGSVAVSDEAREQLLIAPRDISSETARQPLSPQPSQRLIEMHVEVVPDEPDCGGTVGYPAGTDPTLVVNYLEVVDAFSHVPYPGMWASLGVGDPVASALSWDWLFRRITDPFRVNCLRSGLNQVGCSGDTGQTNGTWIDLCDCADRTVVMHEIGHVVHRRGIQAQIPPLFHGGSQPPDPGKGTNQPTTNSFEDLLRIFGDFTETRTDSGTKVGFVSPYSTTNLAENFAEHFMWYVYFGDAFRRRMEGQQAQFGSNLLAEKYGYVSRLFFGISFQDGGGIAGFEGFSI